MSYRRPNNMERHRISASSEEVVLDYLAKLEAMKTKLGIQDRAECIFNMDESGVGKTQDGKGRVIARKGESRPFQQQVGPITKVYSGASR